MSSITCCGEHAQQVDCLSSSDSNLQAAYDSKQEEHKVSDAQWDARHQEAVDSAEQWKEFADKLSREKEDQQQQLNSVNAELQVCSLDSMQQDCQPGAANIVSRKQHQAGWP